MKETVRSPDEQLNGFDPEALDVQEFIKAIARKAHAVEFTCFMQEGLVGLDKYLRAKIDAYARMLESL